MPRGSEEHGGSACGVIATARDRGWGWDRLSVADHLGISLVEYDRRIRTFIPDYDEILEAAAEAVEPGMRTIVDLGIGYIVVLVSPVPRAPSLGIRRRPRFPDTRDGQEAAEGQTCDLVNDDLETVALPSLQRGRRFVQAFTTSERRRPNSWAYRKAFAALRPGGIMVNADCCPASNRKLAAVQMLAWRSHLAEAYPAAQAHRYLRMWAREDVYNLEHGGADDGGLPVSRSTRMWRRGAFAVLAARRPRGSLSSVRPPLSPAPSLAGVLRGARNLTYVFNSAGKPRK